jgi:hypothetical protein
MLRLKTIELIFSAQNVETNGKSKMESMILENLAMDKKENFWIHP